MEEGNISERGDIRSKIKGLLTTLKMEGLHRGVQVGGVPRGLQKGAKWCVEGHREVCGRA